MDYIGDIDKLKVPRHIAVIMDGNGRWAREKGLDRLAGHYQGVESVKELCRGASNLNIEFLTVYAFSKENWNRPREEVVGLMKLLVATLNDQMDTLMENQVRLKVIGDFNSLPGEVKDELNDVISKTSENKGPVLNLALSYSSKWEIAEAAKKIASDVNSGRLEINAISEEKINQYLTTAHMPEPELLIRTGGEKRLSNFMLWQTAYSEFYFTDKFWPEFKQEDLYKAIIDYQKRQRRFGKTGEQTKTEL